MRSPPVGPVSGHTPARGERNSVPASVTSVVPAVLRDPAAAARVISAPLQRATLTPPGQAAPRVSNEALLDKAHATLRQLMPDGHGITLHLVGQREPKTFADPKSAEAFIKKLPASSIRSVIYYGHGAPGMMTIGKDYTIGSGEVISQLKGKMAPNGEVHLFGCNTASIGSRSYEGNPAEMVFYGLSTLGRRLAYFSAPVILGGLDKQTAEAHWDDDMAGETSRGLPGVRVSGFRTFAFPADRLVPGSHNVTPSPHVMARSVTYRDNKEVL